MRAAAYREFGPVDVLRVEDLPAPRPRAGEVRVKVRAAALNPKDVMVRKGKYALLSGRRFPLGTGFDVAGEVETLGRGVTDLAVGERVFGFLGGFRGATCAELALLPRTSLARMPSSLSFAEAAALPLAASTALQGLRDLARVEPGQRVLLHGASGGVGSYAIQLAKALGAHVTTTSSAANCDRCAAMGADVTLTYDDPRAPFAQGQRYDAVLDVFGNRSFAWARSGLEPGGAYLSTVPSRRIAKEILTSLFTAQRARMISVRPRTADLEQLASFVEQGVLYAVIDRILPLEQVAEGHRYLESKRARGKVVIDVAGASLRA